MSIIGIVDIFNAMQIDMFPIVIMEQNIPKNMLLIYTNTPMVATIYCSKYVGKYV
jgi:hypothetical protein